MQLLRQKSPRPALAFGPLGFRVVYNNARNCADRINGMNDNDDSNHSFFPDRMAES